jgi:cytochrome P450
VAESKRGCPVNHTDHTVPTALYGHYSVLNAEREASRFHWNDSTPRGYWMVTRHEDVLEGFQSPERFTNDVTSALNPARSVDLLPQMLNGKEHIKLRRVINPFFAPAAVKRMEPLAHQRCVALVEELKPSGGCDFVAEFAIQYPTELFLALLGLPTSDGTFFLPWVEKVFAGFFGGDQDEARMASKRIMDYFDTAVTERRAAPRDPTVDMISRLVEARIDGKSLPHQEILTICMTLLLAGLDTTRSALGYMFCHLAEHEDDRHLLTRDPSLAPAAVEEFVRLYPLVIQAGRQVSEAVDFHGVPMEAEDVVWLGIGSANRDPRKFPDPDRFMLGRPGVNQHLAFGAGPHRCLGMHLARLELAIVLREWHERIPDYRIRPGTEIRERGGQLSLSTLPLEWEV